MGNDMFSGQMLLNDQLVYIKIKPYMEKPPMRFIMFYMKCEERVQWTAVQYHGGYPTFMEVGQVLKMIQEAANHQ
jgi:hypothetical protein